jgi:hypothetical protein
MGDPTKTTAERLKDSVLSVTKDWTKQRKAEERHASALANRRARLVRASDYYNFKSAAYEVMEKAYLSASDNGALPASARQVMYQARPFIQDKMCGQPLNDQYFCQQLLPGYIEEHAVDWDITYDDRGHFTEPHTGCSIGLGTISVRNYLAKIGSLEFQELKLSPAAIATCGPDGCFGAALFIEKEGFLPLFERVQLAEHFDLAVMSTKGMSVTACRKLADEMCGAHGIPLLVLHDFDKSGFSILGTLRLDTWRYTYANRLKVIDLGLRLEDIDRLRLQAEGVFDRGNEATRRTNLRQNGATPQEIEFLLNQRVELNAMTARQLVTFVEGKLKKYGVKKLIPKAGLLRDAYRLFINNKRVEKIVEKAIKGIENEHIAAPANLSIRVAAYLRQHPELRWDQAVAAIAEADE